MRIRAPKLNTEMQIERVEARDGRIVMRGRVGPFDAAASFAPGELLGLALRCLRPSILGTCVGWLLFGRSRARRRRQQRAGAA